MPGFKIPNWNNLIIEITKAAKKNSKIGYVAWDVAILENGIEIIEANINYPGVVSVQLDGINFKALERAMSLLLK